MDFVTLYGIELDRELGSADRDQLFTTARRKAAINAAQLEFNERTECYTRETSITIVDGTQEYDIEATVTDFHCISKQGVSIKIVSGSNTRYIEGDDLTETTVERLNTEEPGWRAVSAGTPLYYYLRRNGGAVNIGFHPAPDISGTDVWTVILPYVAIAPDMSADADLPFTVSSNAIASLKPYHRALVHFAAFDLEKFRKDPGREQTQMQMFESYVERYKQSMKPKQGQRVRFVRDYRKTRAQRYDPRVVS